MSKPETTSRLAEAKELHHVLVGETVREKRMVILEIKLIKKYLDEAFEAGRAYER